MRADCTGFMGNQDINTPNLDAFARKSIVFKKHMSVHTKCVPSRISLMTGRYSHTDGYRTITQNMVPDQINLLDRFIENGYQTAVFGKNHCWDEHDFMNKLDYNMHKKPYKNIGNQSHGIQCMIGKK